VPVVSRDLAIGGAAAAALAVATAALPPIDVRPFRPDSISRGACR
jgi:hypothetical protein